MFCFVCLLCHAGRRLCRVYAQSAGRTVHVAERERKKESVCVCVRACTQNNCVGQISSEPDLVMTT